MKISDENTIVMNGGKPVKNQENNKKGNGTLWRGVLVGGVPGILLGTGGTAFANNALLNTKEDLTQETDVEANEEAQVEFSDNVDSVDSMSFSEAFAEARAEFGPGAVFTWNGNVYSTYYEEEWNSLTEEQKEEYVEDVLEMDSSNNEVDVVEVTTEVPESEEYYTETSEEEGNVTVLGEEVIQTEDGHLINVTSVEIDGHYGEVYDYNNDGMPDAAIIDVNDDGNPDIALVDENGDGYISDCEIYDMSDPGMLAMGGANPEDVIYEDMPDYTNDADTSCFA